VGPTPRRSGESRIGFPDSPNGGAPVPHLFCGAATSNVRRELDLVPDRGQNFRRVEITGIIWLDSVVDKLARKHHVDIDEVEEVFAAGPRFRFIESGMRSGEDVYAALGRTDAGRYLVTFFVWKADGRALPVSARDMTHSERARYERK
jgi:uncharacterized DUF497 family protein